MDTPFKIIEYFRLNIEYIVKTQTSNIEHPTLNIE